MKKHQRPPFSIEFDANVTLPSLPALSVTEIGSDIESIVSRFGMLARSVAYSLPKIQEQQRQQHNATMQMGYPPIDAFNGMNPDYGIMDSAPFGAFPPVGIHHPQQPPQPLPGPAILVPNTVQNHRHSQTVLPSLTPFRNGASNGAGSMQSGHPLDPYHSNPINSAPIPPSQQRQFAPSPTPYDHPPRQQQAQPSRKRSLSPGRHAMPIMNPGGPLPHMNGWEDVSPPHTLPPPQHSSGRDGYPSHRKSSKLPRIGTDSAAPPPPPPSSMDGHLGHMDDWAPSHGRLPSPSSVPPSMGRTQLPPPRSLHRSSGSGLPSIDMYGAPSSLEPIGRDPHFDRERDRERERHQPYHEFTPYRPPSSSSDRPHLPSPAVLVSEAGLAPWDVLPPPAPMRNGGSGGHASGSSAYWSGGANGAGTGRRDREREREMERDYRDDQMFPAPNGLDPPRPSSQPQLSSGGRASSPTHYRTLPPPPTSSAGSRRTPLPPPPNSSHSHGLPTSPALSQTSHTSKHKLSGGSMSPVHNRLPPPMAASRSGSPPPPRPLSSLGGSLSILAPHPQPPPPRPKSIGHNNLPIFPLPPISSSASYANGAMSMSGSMFSNPAPAPSSTPGAGSNGPSSASPTPGLSMGGAGGGPSSNKSTRPPAVPVE